MNQVQLIGRLHRDPVYHFTESGTDVTRFVLETGVDGASCLHHCLAYGPAAIDLHTHLIRDNLLTVRGELIYRGRTGHRRPAILVRGYSYLDSMAGKAAVTTAPSGSVTG